MNLWVSSIEEKVEPKLKNLNTIGNISMDLDREEKGREGKGSGPSPGAFMDGNQ